MTRFHVNQDEDGQIYVVEDGEQMLHARIDGPFRAEIQVGVGGEVIIAKVYGPLVFLDLRVTMDPDAVEWVVSRQRSDGSWVEVARIAGQPDEEFGVDLD